MLDLILIFTPAALMLLSLLVIKREKTPKRKRVKDDIFTGEADLYALLRHYYDKGDARRVVEIVNKALKESKDNSVNRYLRELKRSMEG